MSNEKRTMRDSFLEELYLRMKKDKNIFFLSVDFGAPKLDDIRRSFPDRFINVGIAEQNLVNVATGLALEGFSVYAFGISTFLSMRAFEQIRIDLALQAQIKTLNVNLIGVGAGLSYGVSGPTHHCLEDLALMRILPNVAIFSPCDWTTAKDFVDYSLKNKTPKYLRFDSKPCAPLVDARRVEISAGFREIKKGEDLCVVSTGHMSHLALLAADYLAEDGINIGLIDMFLLRPFDEAGLIKILRRYKNVITTHEGFLNKGGLDTVVTSLCASQDKNINLRHFGFNDHYIFEIGSRDYLHKKHKISVVDLISAVKESLF